MLAATSGAFAQVTKKRKKSAKPKSPACRVGCKPETTTPALDASTPEDAALQKDLAPLARDLHHGTPGAYDKVAAFANKNAASVWGKRAALALAYDDYAKARFPQAATWLQKADGDTLLKEYTLFWTAQTERSLQKNAQAAQDFAALLKDYSNTALMEQLLLAYVPETVDYRPSPRRSRGACRLSSHSLQTCALARPCPCQRSCA